MASTAALTVGLTGTPNNFAMSKGEDVAVTCTMYPAVDITGWTITFTMKTSFDAATATLTKTVGSGIVLTTAASGIFTITLSSANTSGLAAQGYVFDIVRTNSGSRTVLAVGLIDIRDEVTL